MRSAAIMLFGMATFAAAGIETAAAQSCASGLYWDGARCVRAPTSGYSEPGYPVPRTQGRGYNEPGTPRPYGGAQCPAGTVMQNGACRR